MTADDRGRERHYRLERSGLAPLADWLAALEPRRRFDESVLDGLDLEVRRTTRDRSADRRPDHRPDTTQETRMTTTHQPRPTGRREERRRGRPSLVFERTFRAPIEDVWAAVTESDRLARWIGEWTR